MNTTNKISLRSSCIIHPDYCRDTSCLIVRLRVCPNDWRICKCLVKRKCSICACCRHRSGFRINPRILGSKVFVDYKVMKAFYSSQWLCQTVVSSSINTHGKLKSCLTHVTNYRDRIVVGLISSDWCSQDNRCTIVRTIESNGLSTRICYLIIIQDFTRGDKPVSFVLSCIYPGMLLLPWCLLQVLNGIF